MAADEQVIIEERLRGAAQFQRDALMSARALQGLEKQTDRVGTSMHRSTQRSFAMQQAIFTLRRVIYQATLATGVLATAGVAWGLKFNATMESNKIAFETFLGTEAKANKELAFLFDLAATTPFEFPQLTLAARKFMAFGFTVEETNKLLLNASDAIAAMGLGGEEIGRATLALGQMRAAGRVLGGELRQLQELGLIDPEDFMRRTGISREEWAHIGELMMPSEVAIDAISAYWATKFKGAAQAQSKTVLGEISTLRDRTAQMLGFLTEPLFQRIRDKWMPRLLEMVGEMAEVAKQGGGMRGIVGVLDAELNQHGNILAVYDRLADIGQNLIVIFRQGVVPGTMAAAEALGGLAVPLILVGTWTNILAGNTDILAGVVQLLVMWWILEKAILIALIPWKKANVIWTNRQIYADRLQRWNLRLLRIELFLYGIAIGFTTFWTRLWTLAMYGSIRGANGQFLALTRLEKVLWRLRIATIAATRAAWGFTIALLLNPITWIVLGILLLAGGLAYLYWKYEDLRGIITVITLILFPFAGAILVIAQNWDAVTSAVQRAWDLMVRFSNWLKDTKNFGGGSFLDMIGLGGLGNFGGLINIVGGKQSGGMAAVTGRYVVGEHGPEVVRLSAGSIVEPNSYGTANWGSMLGGLSLAAEAPVQLVVDRRVLAEAVAKFNVAKKARK